MRLLGCSLLCFGSLTLSLACVADPLPPEESVGTTTDDPAVDSSSGTGSTTDDPSADSGTTTTTDDPAADSSTTTSEETDEPPSGGECDPLLQNCPEGEKCVPYASVGGFWDSNKCVPVTGDQMVGEPCTVGDPKEAIDDCDANGWCFGSFDIGGTGSCYAFCGQDEACPDGQTCFVANDDAITVCIDLCIPQDAQSCGEGAVCFEYSEAGEFLCLPAPSMLPADAPCTPFDYCMPGQVCTDAALLDSCAGSSCCTDWCDTAQPDACAAPLGCQPYFAPGEAPAGLETTGVCTL